MEISHYLALSALATAVSVIAFLLALSYYQTMVPVVLVGIPSCQRPDRM